MNIAEQLKQRSQNKKYIDLGDGITVLVRKLTVKEGNEYARTAQKSSGHQEDAALKVVVAATYDHEGHHVFNSVDEVRDTGFDVGSLLFKAIAEYSGMIEPKPEAKKNDSQTSSETSDD